MVQDLNDMLVFASVVENGGISAAARALEIPKSRVSRRLATLENQLGVRLIERNTRSMHTTEAGRIYYPHCKRVADAANMANLSLEQITEEPAGLIRISASLTIGQHLLAPCLAEFLKRYPKIRLDISLTNRRVDLVNEGYDLAIRVGVLEDSSLVSKHLGVSFAAMFAAPCYFEKSDTPLTIAELQHHRLLSMRDSSEANHWTLVNHDGVTQSLEFTPYAAADDFTLLRQLAIDGCGIAFLPHYLGDALTQSGELIRVLPNWQSRQFSFHALYPSRLGVSLKQRACLDFFAAKMMSDNSL